MGKGVVNLWRYAQVADLANRRYLEALACVEPKGEAIDALDRLCRPRIMEKRRFARFNPISRQDQALFQAVLAGDNALRGFRNRDICQRLYPKPARTRADRRRQSAHISRQIRKLRAHRLIAKVPGCRRYRVTAKGYQTMSAALAYRIEYLPQAYREAA